MANLPVIDATGGTVYLKATGVGTNGDPYVPLQGGGTVATGNAGTIAVIQAGTVDILKAGTVQVNPVTSGGLSPYRDINAGTSGSVVKNSPGQLYGYYLGNTGTITAYVKLYDKASAPGTADVPVMTLPIPGTAAANVGFPFGVVFANGIGVRATTGVGDTDATAPGGSVVIVNLLYK